MAEARYTVRAVKFRCGDESGPDWSGSDEPYFVFTARDQAGKTMTTRSMVFGDVDSGEERSFKDNAVVWPAKGATAGAPGPIGLSVQLWEKDQGDPDQITKRTNQVMDLGRQAPVVGDWVKLVPKAVTDQLANTLADDLMGSTTLLFSATQLAKRLPKPGASFQEKYHLGGRSGDLPFEVAGGPDYHLSLEVARVS